MEAEAVLNLQNTIIEPLDPGKHDRAAFSCGVGRLDIFLKRTANRRLHAGLGYRGKRTNRNTRLLCAERTFIEGSDLPAPLTKDAPRSGCIPAAYLSMIAVDRRYQGRKLGHILLADALARAVGAADSYPGLKAVALDVIEDGGAEITEKRRAFHAPMGFHSFPSNPLRMFITVEAVRNASQQHGRKAGPRGR